MFITESKLTFSFPRNLKVRQEAFFLENLLSEFLTTPLQIFSIPDDAPSELVRISGNSKNGHTNLFITQNSFILDTRFDGEYLTNWNLCKIYLEEKVAKIFEALRIISKNEILMSGATVKVLFPIPIDDSSVNIVNKILGTTKFLNNIYDLGFKVSFIEENLFFVNYIVEVVKNYQIQEIKNRTDIHYYNENLKSELIQLTIDINDRKIAIFSENYLSSRENFLKIMSLMTFGITEKARKIVERGEWE